VTANKWEPGQPINLDDPEQLAEAIHDGSVDRNLVTDERLLALATEYLQAISGLTAIRAELQIAANNTEGRVVELERNLASLREITGVFRGWITEGKIRAPICKDSAPTLEAIDLLLDVAHGLMGGDRGQFELVSSAVGSLALRQPHPEDALRRVAAILQDTADGLPIMQRRAAARRPS
jgi:hypothetical protein